jgi:glycosyltransferase involved in cell wall biosynthesis
MLSVLAELRQSRPDQYVVFGDSIAPAAPVLAGASWELQPMTAPTLAARFGRRLFAWSQSYLSAAQRDVVRDAYQRLRRPRGERKPDLPQIRSDVREWHQRCAVDLMIYPAPTTLAFEAGTPYVMAIHDLQHRLHPEFPEVSADNQLAEREYLFRNGIRNAVMVITDSAVGKEDVLSLYDGLIDADRVAVLPFLPSVPARVDAAEGERVRRSHRLPDRYLFYPAQFWPHKNHVRIVEALGRLQRGGIEPDLVLAGSASGKIRKETFAAMLDTARDLGIEKRVHHLGYVPSADMGPLYAEAVALVMPTFFGPTNIPILEAWGLNCAVITSDIRGVREQAGNAALLADPSSVEEIAFAIKRVWNDEDVRNDLIVRGRQRLATYTRDNYATRLSEILDTAKRLVIERDSSR